MSTGGFNFGSVIPKVRVAAQIDLPALVKERPGRRKRFRIKSTEPTLAADRGYEAALRAMLRGAWDVVEAVVLPAVGRAVARRDGFSDDTGVDAALNRLERELLRRLTKAAENMVTRVLNLERKRNTKQFAQAVRAALGIDLSSVISEGGLTEVWEDITKRNAMLIKRLADATREKVRLAVQEAVIRGDSVKTLRARLREDFGVLDSRAKLIARDQVAKANSQLNQARQQQAGIAEYEWSSSRDERVRPLHKELNGRTFRWNEPGPDGGLHPGEPINCRCVAIGIITF